jgi:hypothetical protein
MSLSEKTDIRRSRTVGDACPAWCVLDHKGDAQPAIILHESRAAAIEISGPRDADVAEWIDVRTTQYIPEEPSELPRSPVVELSYHHGNRYRVTTLTADEAHHLAASLFAAAAHAMFGRQVVDTPVLPTVRASNSVADRAGGRQRQ